MFGILMSLLVIFFTEVIFKLSTGAITVLKQQIYLLYCKSQCCQVNVNILFRIKMSRFSGVLQLTDLDDFITPSQVIM